MININGGITFINVNRTERKLIECCGYFDIFNSFRYKLFSLLLVSSEWFLSNTYTPTSSLNTCVTYPIFAKSLTKIIAIHIANIDHLYFALHTFYLLCWYNIIWYYPLQQLYNIHVNFISSKSSYRSIRKWQISVYNFANKLYIIRHFSEDKRGRSHSRSKVIC